LTILRLAKEREELRVVDDQIGAPTWCRTIAEATAKILARLIPPDERGKARVPPAQSWDEGISGTYHLSAGGRTAWYGFASAIVDAERETNPKLARVTPIATEEYPLPAPRPKNSLLDNARLAQTFGLKQMEWKELLVRCLQSG
ncbi:MAG: sugar nucleotide-binding protein, partial [Pseudomonadota bacterium]